MKKVDKIKRKKKTQPAVEFKIEDLKKDILREAKSLKIDLNFAEIMAENTAVKIAKWVEKRVTCTQNDLNQRIANEIKRYSEDLAYVYQNRDKII